MRKQRLFVGLGLLLLALCGGYALPFVYWPVAGWYRGEAFFDGMPTSYWEKEIKLHYEFFPYEHIIGEEEVFGWLYHRDYPVNAWLNGVADLNLPEEEFVSLSLLKHEQKALRVLAELLKSDSVKVRTAVAHGLCGLGPKALPAVPRLVAVLNELRPRVTEETALLVDELFRALEEIDPETAVQLSRSWKNPAPPESD